MKFKLTVYGCMSIHTYKIKSACDTKKEFIDVMEKVLSKNNFIIIKELNGNDYVLSVADIMKIKVKEIK
jgi:hypothetical protein